MPKINENRTNKNTVIIAAILVTLALAGIGYFAWQKSIDNATREATKAERLRYAEELTPPPIAPPPEPTVTPPAPTPLPFPEATPAPAAPAPQVTVVIDPCKEATDKIQAFFNYLDQQDYMAAYTTNETSEELLVQIAKKLYANPPVVNRETDDLFTILTNSAHFYRILGKTNLLMLKDILIHESDKLEPLMADFYHWSEKEVTCDAPTFPLQLPLNSLYEYSGFFLNTLGGQSYLFRRKARTRMLIKYYAVLIIDRTNEKGLNRHGIDIRGPLRSTIEEMEVSQNIEQRDAYMEKLLQMQAKYQEKYGHQ